MGNSFVEQSASRGKLTGIEGLRAQLDELRAVMDEHSAVLERHSNILDRQSLVLDRQSTVLSRLEADVDKQSIALGRLEADVELSKAGSRDGLEVLDVLHNAEMWETVGQDGISEPVSQLDTI